MYLKELFYLSEEPLRVTVDEGVPAWLIAIVRIDTSSSQWRKTKRGSKKTKELMCVQFALKKLGYNPGPIDGWFGRKTARAVMSFQKDNDLVVDGDPGRNTIGKMIEIGKQEYPAAKDLSRKNVDDRFPLDKNPIDDCGAIINPEPEPRYLDQVDNRSKPEPKQSKGPDDGSRDFDPKSAVDGKTVIQVNALLADLLRSYRFEDALAVLDYDLRLDIDQKTYDTIKDLASKKESLEEKQVWAKSGNKVVRKYRCTSGPRKGRTVAQITQCFAAPDIAKRIRLRQTKARLGSKMARKARKTKRVNPASVRVARLNK